MGPRIGVAHGAKHRAGPRRAAGPDAGAPRLSRSAPPARSYAAAGAAVGADADAEAEAEDERARGREAAQRVRALADRTVVETLSEAEREASVTRGEADARRNAVYAEAYGADAEFFNFYRSLQAYEQALQAGNSSLVITPDSSFFDYLKSDAPR